MAADVDVSKWRDLAEVARWAPSPHNTQPWFLQPVSPDRATLFMLASRRLPDEDTTGCFLICAMGIFIEALRIAAANRGWRLTVEHRPPLRYDRERIVFAELSLGENGEPDRFSDDTIVARRTSRLPSLPEPLGQDTEQILAEVAEAFGHEFRVIAEPPTIRELLDRNIEAVLHDLSDPKYGGEISGWYRYTRKQGRLTGDGLEARCINIPAHELWLTAHCPWLLRMPLAGTVLTPLYRHRIGRTDRMFALSGPFFDRDAAERAGTLLLRLWLALHECGGGMHPFGNLVTNAEAHARISRTLGLSQIWFVARFGRTLEPPRSERLEVGDLVNAE